MLEIDPQLRNNARLQNCLVAWEDAWEPRFEPLEKYGEKWKKHQVHSGNLTKQWKIHHLKMQFLFKMGMFHCYVCLPEGTHTNLRWWFCTYFWNVHPRKLGKMSILTNTCLNGLKPPPRNPWDGKVCFFPTWMVDSRTCQVRVVRFYGGLCSWCFFTYSKPWDSSLNHHHLLGIFLEVVQPPCSLHTPGTLEPLQFCNPWKHWRPRYKTWFSIGNLMQKKSMV